MTDAEKQNEHMLRRIMDELRHISRRLEVIESRLKPAEVITLHRGGRIDPTFVPAPAPVFTQPTTGTPPGVRPQTTC